MNESVHRFKGRLFKEWKHALYRNSKKEGKKGKFNKKI